MADLHSAIAQYGATPDRDLKVTVATGTDMDQRHKDFLKELIALIDSKAINPRDHESFVYQEKLKGLSEQNQSRVTIVALNMASLVQHIEWYFRSTTTPNASPQLQNMIDQLWQMKDRVETELGDVYKF